MQAVTIVQVSSASDTDWRVSAGDAEGVLLKKEQCPKAPRFGRDI